MEYILQNRRNKLLHYSNDKTFSDFRKILRNSINQIENERQSKRNPECPIYIHEYNKIPNYSVNNKNFVNVGVVTLKCEHAKSVSNENAKKMIHRLEETYWATWKPNKSKNKNEHVKRPKTPKSQVRRDKVEKVNKDNIPCGDAAGELIQYFSKPNFSSTGSVSDEKNSQWHFPPVMSHSKSPIRIKSLPVVENEDQTEKSSNALDKNVLETSVWSGDSEATLPVKSLHSDKTVVIKDKGSDNQNENGSNNNNDDDDDDLKEFNHTDSFVINEKKKLEPKMIRFQQPKCIKLYRKSTVNNYIKGGSYPLKSSKKKETSTRNFRLGPPGQLIVTGSSFSKNIR